MATPYDLLKAENQELKLRIQQLGGQLQTAKAVHDQYREEKQQRIDLIFALLHTLGPRIDLAIGNFHEGFANAQYDGTVGYDEENDTYEAHLYFYVEGIEEHFRRKLCLGATPSQVENREQCFQTALFEQATPEEAYTLAIVNFPNNI
jgi:hypothetical protein